MSPLPPPSAAPFFSLSHPFALRSLLLSTQKVAPLSDKHPLPTRTLPPLEMIPRSLASLFRRQVTTVTATASPTRNTVTATPLIPANYAGIDSGPAPGVVVGIVFGSVAGFLLLLWLIYTCFGLGGGGRSSVVEEEIIRRRSRSPSRRRSSPRRSSPRRPPSTVRSRSRSVSEVIEVRSTRERTPPPPRRESRRETVIIEETRRPVRQEEDDIVDVIEEHSPAPPRERRKSSGYRNVDPTAFGGGNKPLRKVSRR